MSARRWIERKALCAFILSAYTALSERKALYTFILSARRYILTKAQMFHNGFSTRRRRRAVSDADHTHRCLIRRCDMMITRSSNWYSEAQAVTLLRGISINVERG